MKVKEESEKVVLKLNIQKTKIMASGPITSWQIDGETMEAVTDGDCSHEIKRCLLLWRKTMKILGRILKSKDITLPTKVHIVKCAVLPSIMYGCESCTMKKAEHQRMGAFELCCWRRLLRVHCTGREIKPVHPKGNQSWIFIRRTDAEAETPVLWLPDAKDWLTGKYSDSGKD